MRHDTAPAASASPRPAHAGPPARPALAATLARRCADPAGPAGLVLAALLALAFAWWLLGAPFLHGTASFWLRGDDDIAQYLSGYNAYVREAWHWPLLRIESINAPDGTLATFLDTVPLYAMLLKLLHHGPGLAWGNPYPAWIMLCYLLQGAGAWWLCREAGVRSWPALLALALLLAAYPALTHRIHHTSLMSQWLLLFALALYLRGTRLGRLAAGGWTALLLGAFYINIYLFCMCGLLYGADLLRHASRDGLRRLALPTLLPPLLLALSLPATMLPLGGGGGGEWGFGYYSMNLLGPMAGGKLLLFPHPVANDGQGEGYNYLGVFLLAACGYALRLRARHDPGCWRRHRVLGAMLAALTLYALSNTVYLGQTELFQVALPGFTHVFTDQMRASGRFFWPVGYALMAFTVLTVARHVPRRRAAALLALLVALQLWDLQPKHQGAHAEAAAAVPARLDQARWDGFLGPATRHLQVYPPFGCTRAAPIETVLPTMHYAVQRELSISSGYVARVHKPCTGYGAEIATIHAPSTAFVFIKPDFANLAQVEQLLGGSPGAACIEADFAYLCKRRPAMEKPQ